MNTYEPARDSGGYLLFLTPSGEVRCWPDWDAPRPGWRQLHVKTATATGSVTHEPRRAGS